MMLVAASPIVCFRERKRECEREREIEGDNKCIYSESDGRRWILCASTQECWAIIVLEIRSRRAARTDLASFVGV